MVIRQLYFHGNFRTRVQRFGRCSVAINNYFCRNFVERVPRSGPLFCTASSAIRPLFRCDQQLFLQKFCAASLLQMWATSCARMPVISAGVMPRMDVLRCPFLIRSRHRGISVRSLTFSLVDYPNPCHPGYVRQGHAGEPDADSAGIGADGATTPETLRHQDRLAGRSGERRDTASTEGDICAARRGLISQVPRQMGASWSASADLAHA